MKKPPFWLIFGLFVKGYPYEKISILADFWTFRKGVPLWKNLDFGWFLDFCRICRMRYLSETEAKFDVNFWIFLLKSISFTICFQRFKKCEKTRFFHFFVFCDLKKGKFYFLTKWWFSNIWSFRRRGKGGGSPSQFFGYLLQFKKQK